MIKTLKTAGIFLLIFILGVTLLWVVDKTTNKGYIEVDFDYSNKILYVDNEVYDFEIFEKIDISEKSYMTVYYYDEDLGAYSLLNGKSMTKVFHYDGKYYIYIGDITNEELNIIE